ncbi:hypothetical protein SY83_09710 [Paenibacillus swuensis]|uniref:histidine kinase n=1 Tax=Paenibacillus swuensis TaxID=1178515 RepID=A0A172THH9_9BACL|nr:ATP-binding protein [Paenibacillus swuensis]ANE46509.1 hypothetical protein SY83_09710 [Paenibacillus swuensis]
MMEEPILRYGTIGLKWCLFVAGIASYAYGLGHLAGVMLIALFVQTLQMILQFKRTRGIPFQITVTGSLMFNMYLLGVTGGLSSPFLLYVLADLLCVKLIMKRKLYYVVTAVYLVSIPIVFASSGITTIYEHRYYAVYGFYICLFYGLSAGLQWISGKVMREIRNAVTLYSHHRLHTRVLQHDRIRGLEQLLASVLNRSGKDVMLTFTKPGLQGTEQEWSHVYYANYLKLHPPARVKSYLVLPSITGDPYSTYVQGLKDRKGVPYGWLLIRAQRNEINILHQLYIRIVLMSLETAYDQEASAIEMQEKAVLLERNQIAQNIHDGIAQELFFISIQLFQLRSALPAEAEQEALPLLREIEKKVKDSHRGMRNYIMELKDEKRKINLHHAIETLLDRITANTGVTPVFRKSGWVPDERLEVEEAIYHLVEEAANNVIKHAKATRLQVNLEVTSVQWTIVIHDDGVGMEDITAAQVSGRFGLTGMENRIKSFNGAISFQSDLSSGTTVTAYIPRERTRAYV